MIRDTSREAYAAVLPELNDRQAVVLGLLERSEPLTNSEIADALDWKINCVTPRVLELRNLGKVTEHGKRMCRMTGRTANAWTVPRQTLF